MGWRLQIFQFVYIFSEKTELWKLNHSKDIFYIYVNVYNAYFGQIGLSGNSKLWINLYSSMNTLFSFLHDNKHNKMESVIPMFTY